MFIINRCFKNIWLESQMIHVALFSFQRTTLSFQNRLFFRSLRHLLFYRSPFSLSRVFLKFLFCLNSKLFAFRCLPVKASHLSAPVSLAATCIILHASPLLVNTFFEKMIKEDEQLWDEQLLVFFGKESFILERNGGSGIHFTSCREALGDIGFPYRQLHCNRAI